MGGLIVAGEIKTPNLMEHVNFGLPVHFGKICEVLHEVIDKT